MAKHFFGLTDTGKIRDNNEDSFITESIAGDSQLVLAAVIDGVGGYHGGEVAAAIAKEEIEKEFVAKPTDTIKALISAFRRASSAILARKLEDKDLSSMACVATLVVADIANNQFYYAHVGDTRLYLLRDGSLVKISKDHSFVGFLEDSGRLNEDAAMKHPKRNEINKALGFSELIETDESYIETGQSPFLPGDLLLLCSDGLTDMVDRKEITRIINQTDTLNNKATQLVALANENGGRDNITVVLVQNDKPAQLLTHKPDKVYQEEKIVEMPVSTEQLPVANQPKRNYSLLALALLCIVLLASTIVLYFRSQKKPKDETVKVQQFNQTRNKQELLLQDAIDHTRGDTLILSDTLFKSPIILTDTLRIRRDTLYILAKGLMLEADSTYKGAALGIAAQCKFTSLDSLLFSGFNTAIAVQNTPLHLKNVSFINCTLPVQNNYYFIEPRVNAKFETINGLVKPVNSPKAKK